MKLWKKVGHLSLPLENNSDGKNQTGQARGEKNVFFLKTNKQNQSKQKKKIIYELKLFDKCSLSVYATEYVTTN